MPKVEIQQTEILDRVRKKLGHYSGEKPVQLWLDTGSPELHRVLGSPRKGIPYGKMLEISGKESNGKTYLMLLLAVKAQKDGALVIILDFESSFDYRWARKLGLNTDSIVVIQPYLKKGKKAKADDVSMAGCESLCEEAMEVVKSLSSKYDKFFLGVDSIASMVTERELAAGEADANMATNTELSRFLSRTLKQWTGKGLVHNVMFVFLNQLRMRPGVMFGDPEYTPGGNSAPFYFAIRARIRRGSNKGRMTVGGQQIGIKGTLANVKNKVGAGSIEHEKIGFKFFFDKRPAQFIEAKDIKKEDE